MSTPTAAPALPTLLRQGISWRVAGDHLVVELDFRNDSDEPTTEDVLIIEAAPLGAFIPGRPVARRTLAGFDPGERRRETIRIPLQDVEAATGAILGKQGAVFREFVPDPATGKIRVEETKRILGAWVAGQRARRVPLFWGGNLFVYFDRAPESAVERHCGGFTEVEPGSRGSLSFCIMGAGDYTIRARASEPGWVIQASLSQSDGTIDVLAPEETGARATIEALVTRKSDGQTVPVEFELQTVTREEFKFEF